MREIMTLHEVLKTLVEAKRLGASVDNPEGTRFIQISDTLAGQMIEAIREAIQIYHPPKKEMRDEALGPHSRHHAR